MSLATAAAAALVRPWVLPAAGAAVAALLLALAGQSWRVHSLQVKVAEAELATQQCAAGRGADRAAWAAVSASAVTTARMEAQRQQDETRRILDDERSKAAALAADAAALRGELGGVRAAARAAAAAADQRVAAAERAASAGSSEPAISPAGVLADVFGECLDALGDMAEEADRRGLAGVTSWRERDSLTTRPEPGTGSAHPE